MPQGPIPFPGRGCDCGALGPRGTRILGQHGAWRCPVQAHRARLEAGYSGSVILLTGATGVVGGELLPALLAAGQPVRVLVRDPRKLGEYRVDVQITLGDLRDPFSVRHGMRGV